MVANPASENSLRVVHGTLTLLRQEGWTVNFKRIYRLWKREGLKVSMKKRKKQRLGTSEGGITRRRAECPNHVWSIDFIFDRTEKGRSLKILSVIDEFTRECVTVHQNHCRREV